MKGERFWIDGRRRLKEEVRRRMKRTDDFSHSFSHLKHNSRPAMSQFSTKISRNVSCNES